MCREVSRNILLKKSSTYAFPCKSYLVIFNKIMFASYGCAPTGINLYCVEKSIMQESGKMLKMSNNLYSGFTCEV